MKEKRGHVLDSQPSRRTQVVSIRTNLLELVSVIDEVVGDGDESLVAQTVLHLVETGRLRLLRPAKETASSLLH
jgi:hypothetical protein